jgi:hypothetical protein
MRQILTILTLFVFLNVHAQNGNRQLFSNISTASGGGGGVVGGGGNPYPTFVSENETGWNTNTSPKTTAAINVETGDVLIAFAANPDLSFGDISIAGGGLTWTQQRKTTSSSAVEVWLWSTIATSNTSFTVSFTQTGSASVFGGNVLVFRNSAGIGASAMTVAPNSAPSLNLTTTAANSAIVVINGDWNGRDGATRTWRTVNGITPTPPPPPPTGNGLELTYFQNTIDYGVYGAYYSDVGAVGIKTVGLTVPSNQTYSIIAIEVKGD